MKATIPFFVAIAVVSASAHAFNGNEWRNLGDSARTAYVSGVVDTWGNVLQMSRGGPGKDFAEVFAGPRRCITNMTYNQIKAIVEKYMNNHPEKWHYEMPSIVWVALDAACEANK